MYCGQDRTALCGINPVAERLEPLMQLGPERDAVGDGRGDGHRPQPGDVLVHDPAVGAAGCDEAGLQPAIGLADKHRSGTLAPLATADEKPRHYSTGPVASGTPDQVTPTTLSAPPPG